MSHQTIQSFTPGTLVWIKIYNRIWWPGKIVDPITAPQELQEFMNRKKNPIAMVYFERDKKYDIVINMDKISLYSCPKKMEFVKKGYSLYLKEQKGTKIQNVEMKNFLKDVVEFEKEIGGDINIFKEFENEDKEHAPPPKELIKELFVSSKSTKKSLTNFKTPLQLTKSLKSAGPSKFQENPVSKTRASSIQSSRRDGNFVCHLKDGCNFTTNRYEILKRHMALCKTIVEDVTNSELKSKSQKPRDRTKGTPTKINVDVLKDRDDGEDQVADNLPIHKVEPGCSTESNKEKILTKFNDNISHIATDATENVDEHLDGAKSELKYKSQKRRNRTQKNFTKKTKINDDVLKDCDDGEDQIADNLLIHNVEPGCSTESNKEKILSKFYDHIMDIATDATENVDEHLDGAKSELKYKSQKRTNRTKRNFTKKTKINDDVLKDCDDGEDQSADNLLIHNAESGCSTESNKEDNEETILTKFYDHIMDIATDATENVDEHLDGAKSELKYKSQKRKNKTKSNSTKKTKINYDVLKYWDDGEDHGTDNSLNHNAEPGCSTESNKEDDEKILTKVNDNIMDIATDATEDVDEYLEDSVTFEKELGHICIDSNTIIEPIPSVSGTNMLRNYSYRGRNESETNDIPNLNMTYNTQENTINDSSEENMRNMPSSSSQQFIYPFIEESVEDKEENLDQSCSTNIILFT
ncbi:PWWP domain [Cinara cedri]|uniref:PWWP domain n=1 Tax=Cinara cedri TaxID=506608 RepID=A0A5E4NH55_9HEMI|nr:PWWP domain [Cinara cedri]